jgi:predicted nucleic acid-binding protein
LILVDSSVWIGYLRGVETRQTEKLDRLLGREPLAIGDLFLMEVLQGIDSDREFHEVLRLLTTLTLVELGGSDLAVQAARNFRSLRQRGVTVRKTVDTVIATRCIETGFTLLYDDRDFDGFAKYLGLKVA